MSISSVAKSRNLLAQAKAAATSIGAGASRISSDADTVDIPIDGKLVEDLHKGLNDCIDGIHKEPRPCCPHFLNQLKVYRLFFKRWLAKQPSTSPALA